MISKTVKLLFFPCLYATISVSGALAQAPRTFVSGLGVDGGACTRIAPCRAFSAAIAQTSAGGEVVALDSAGYAVFTVTQAVSIVVPPGVYAGVSVFSGNGVQINAGAPDIVVLRGLTINNQGSSGSGIVFNTGGLLYVESCVVNGFSNGTGIWFLANSNGKLEVKDSIIRGNLFGIDANPSVAQTGLVTIDRTRFERNASFALRAAQRSKVTVRNSLASGNSHAFEADSNTAEAAELNVENCIISNNGGVGVSASSSSTGIATARVSNSTITDNNFGLFNSGAPALVLSRGNNTVAVNSTNTHGTLGSYTAK